MLVLLWIVQSGLYRLGAHASVGISRLTITPVERGTFMRDIVADGKIVAANSPVIYSPSNGSVTMLVHAGDRVKAGDVIVRISNPELGARLVQEHAAQQADQLDLNAAVLNSHVQLLNAREARERALVDRNTAARELERSRKAYAAGAYPELQVMRAEDALQKAEFALNEAESLLRLQPERNRFEVDSRKSVLDRQDALVAELQREVDALSIRSPVDGQIGQLLVADRAVVARDMRSSRSN
jgi:HlyD family secretion protein